jgi:hypothetical protein
MRKVLEIGGFIAAIVLICFGVASIVMGVNARNTVQTSLKQEQIVGTPDMTPSLMKAEIKQAGLPDTTPIPSVSVAGLPINSGDRAHAFAGYMRDHTLMATGGQTYAQMARYASPDGKGTNDPALATKDANGQPVSNAARDIWVTSTALSTALQTSYMADQLSLFGIVVGIALLLSGIGFGVLALGGALRNRDTALTFLRHREPAASVKTGTVQPV